MPGPHLPIHRVRRPRLGVLALAALVLIPAAARAQAPTPGAAQAGRPADPVPELRGETPAGEATQVRIAAGDRILLGVTDREGRARLAEWMKGLASTADSAHFRRVVVVALPGMIPAPFRSSIRDAFPKSGPTTYLLDWGGSVVSRVAGDRPLPCVLVIGPAPSVVASECGAADSTRIAALARTVRAPGVASR
ncbi:MAG: hypothetical protein ACYC1S_08100 [Gemmatimonadaceae bacterium]